MGYDVKKQLVGNVDGVVLHDEIIEFFNDQKIRTDDTVLFYYSGHGIPGPAGDVYLSSSNIDPEKPMKRGFSFDDLTTMMQSCRSKCLVTILDCCYSGSAKISKGDEKAKAKFVQKYQSEKINNMTQGEGKCLLSASLGSQESFATMEGNHSFFTHYLLNGFRGADGKSVDKDGIVTPESLMQYIDSEIDNLPAGKRPTQTPLRKIESSGRIILASYPELATSNESEKRENEISINKTIFFPGEQLEISGYIKNNKESFVTAKITNDSGDIIFEEKLDVKNNRFSKQIALSGEE